MSIEFYSGDPDGVADFILGSMQEKQHAARTPIAERAGEPYCPSSGTEGMAFEADWCERCDRYRPMREMPDVYDCTKGILVQAHSVADARDPAFPKEWVYDDTGRPSCSAWITRTVAADARPERLCAGALTPEQEKAAYERAMRGEA